MLEPKEPGTTAVNKQDQLIERFLGEHMDRLEREFQVELNSPRAQYLLGTECKESYPMSW